MNAEIKREWVAALRSGVYKQGANGLVIGETFCCLGVLGALCGGKPVDLKDRSAGRTMEFAASHTWGGAYLPISITHPIRLNMRDQINLAKLNDTGKTFPQIADHIEAHL